MRILIFDHLHVGHHLNTVRLLVNACSPLVEQVVVATTPEGARSPEFAEHMSGLPGNTEVDATVAYRECEGKLLKGMRNAQSAWEGLCDVVERHRPDHLYVPYVDALIQAALVSRRRPAINPAHSDAILLAGAFAYSGLPFRRRMRARFELASMRGLPFGRLMLLDEIAYDWLVRHKHRLADHSHPSPDPVSPVLTVPRPEARRRLGIAAEGRIIGCMGMLDARKGVDEFIRAFATDKGLRPDDRLLLAGAAKPEVIAAVNEVVGKIGAGRIVLIDRTLPYEEFSLTICASDLIAVPYRFPEHIGCASVALRAAAAGRPVLADEMGWPGQMTRMHELGWIYRRGISGPAGEISKALEKAVDWIPGAKATAFAEFHSVSRFVELMTRPLRS